MKKVIIMLFVLFSVCTSLGYSEPTVDETLLEPIVELVVSQMSNFTDETIYFIPVVENGTEPYTYYWSYDGTKIISTSVDADSYFMSNNYSIPGIHTVSVRVVDANGLTSNTSEVSVRIFSKIEVKNIGIVEIRNDNLKLNSILFYDGHEIHTVTLILEFVDIEEDGSFLYRLDLSNMLIE